MILSIISMDRDRKLQELIYTIYFTLIRTHVYRWHFSGYCKAEVELLNLLILFMFTQVFAHTFLQQPFIG